MCVCEFGNYECNSAVKVGVKGTYLVVVSQQIMWIFGRESVGLLDAISILSPYFGTTTDADFGEALGMPCLLKMAVSLIECGQVLKRSSRAVLGIRRPSACRCF
jgi:hypothetical protein